jgi:hypothetical protein
VRDNFEFEIFVRGIGIVPPDIRIHRAGAGKRPHGAHLVRALRGQRPDALDAADKAGFVGADVSVVVHAFPERIEHGQDLFPLLLRQIPAHAPHRIDRVIDAVPADLLEDVHDQFAVAPDIHE